ncbi:hypothetical protein CC80DRAFT_317551 [Byssothecium circinans]|uniref:Nucleolar 27S pre-rRNA processing Urb2/Npa2 C-terminal domain-containing protein n=1 Tax=Byssothecium circinans TaxID=147558 RepID=A0A6A5T6S9_9PLEO|nr:hypothetical protein CC80DRAFT_317551 [Byssothecium circinans]
MAKPVQAPQASTPTLPRLQAVKQTQDADLDEQIRQVAQIIRLPEDWETLPGDVRAIATQKLVLARADYVLRWVLEKLNDAAENGAQARANTRAWRLLDWMVHALPTSRCAPTLRDSHFLDIVEQTLQEMDQSSTVGYKNGSREVSESSETVQEEPQPSRKRKRGSTGTNTPSKRTAVDTSRPIQLFDVVTAVIQTIRNKAEVHGFSESLAQAEQMKMVLKTESSQAARILKWWLSVVQRLSSSAVATHHLNLSSVIDIWELRTIDAKDSSRSSTEEFSTECLLPVLELSQKLRTAEFSYKESETATILRDSINTLDKLVARHLLAPARQAFLNKSRTSNEEDEPGSIATSLVPLRAKLLQAAQIEDAGDPVPESFRALFSAVPQLLQLIIRSSPARSRKSRIAERPWFQAAFIALAECAGCALQVPEFKTPDASIDAVREMLRVLAAHDVRIDTSVLADLFWYHSGFKFPLGQATAVHWSLVASLVELDSDIFLRDPRSTWHNTGDKPEDLTTYLFDEISAVTFDHPGTTDADAMDIDEHRGRLTASPDFSQEDVVQTIIVPILSAFTRNRDLLGFISRWDEQLSRNVKCDRAALQQPMQPIWEDRNLITAIAAHFERSLTPTQIEKLFQKHAKRLKANTKSTKCPSDDVSSSSVIIQAMLLSLTSDEVIAIVKPHLLSLWNSYTSWIQDGSPTPSNLRVAWLALSELLILLWPIQFHASLSFQEEHLYPLIEQASKEVGSVRKDQAGRRVDSKSRATALAFLLAACDCLRSLPGIGELIQKRLRRALKCLSPSHVEVKELAKMTEILCTGYVQLLGSFDSDTCQALLSTLLSTISTLMEKDAENIAEAFAQSAFIDGDASFQSSYVAALLDAIAQDDDQLHDVAITSLLQVVPSSISRAQREAVLDRTMAILTTQPRNVGTLLSLMVHLMEITNATAKVSSDGAGLFNIAQALHDADLETTSSLQLLQSLARLTLVHIIPNKDQTQNVRFLEVYKAQIASATKKASKCFPARLALLSGTFTARDADSLLSVDRYFAFLLAILQDEPIPSEHILKAFNDVPMQVLKDHGEAVDAARAALRKWFRSKLSWESVPIALELTTFNSLPLGFWPALHRVIARYRLCEDDRSFILFSLDLLRKDVRPDEKKSILSSVKDAVEQLDTPEKLALLPLCCSLADNDGDAAVPCSILHQLVSAMEDKQQVDAALKQQQLAILPTICLLLEDSKGEMAFNSLLDSVITVLKDKPSLTTQHGAECVLAALCKLTSRNSPRLSTACAPAIFTRLCETTRLLLLLQRSRIGGRFHLLLPLLQNLLLCLFIPNAGRGAALPPWLDSYGIANPVRLSPANASTYTRLLTTVCSPTQSSVQRYNKAINATSKKQLNDPVKAARDYASQYMYPLLSSFCRYQLYGRLDPQVREKLMPGIWEVVRVGSLDRQSLDTMFEGLGKSERDVWRGLWRDWMAQHGRGEIAERT